DGIRDFHVTGVQTCALPISAMTTGPQSMPVFNDMTLTPDEKRDIIAFIDAQKEGSPGGLDLGSLGPVSEGLWVFVVGMGLLIARSDERRVGKAGRYRWGARE